MFPVNFILIWSVVIFGGIIIQSISSKLVNIVDEILNREEGIKDKKCEFITKNVSNDYVYNMQWKSVWN